MSQLLAGEARELSTVPISKDEEVVPERFIPEPHITAIAVMAMLAFGVLVGALTGPVASSAGLSPLVLEMGPGKGLASAPAPE